MERVVVLGCGGSGKSTLARRLGERTGVPVVYLDRIFWRPGWTPAPVGEARAALAAAVAGERWILDGNFLGESFQPQDERFARADTVVFLDLPRRTCLRRALWRLVRDRGRRRADLPDGCGEGVDLAFLRWIWSYRRRDRPRVLALLAALGPHVAVHRLASPAAVERFAAPEPQGLEGGC